MSTGLMDGMIMDLSLWLKFSLSLVIVLLKNLALKTSTFAATLLPEHASSCPRTPRINC